MQAQTGEIEYATYLKTLYIVARKTAQPSSAEK